MNGPTPTLRLDLNIGTTWLLPEWSTGPRGGEQVVLEAAREAGYRGIQGADPKRCRDLGLVPTTFDIRGVRGGLVERARRWADLGYACSTLLLGTGMEGDDAAARLVEEVLEASTTAGIPIYVETHCATVTQDVWRTLQLVRRFPELRFNGDFSHWYTGHDVPSGDFEAKLDLLSPVFERVRYLHGRIGTAGCIQVDVGDDGTIGAPGHEIGFAPELLPSEFGYARLVSGPDGKPREEGDRWAQALVLTRIAAECFTVARVNTTR